MKQKKTEKKEKDGLLDLTVNDFEDQEFTFRFPKRNSVVTQFASNKKSRGRRPTKSANLSSKVTPTLSSQSNHIVNTVDLAEESQESNLTVSTQSSSYSNLDIEIRNETLDDLNELEKSVCSEVEKLCPSCKHIVLLDEYPDHVSKCLQKYSYSKHDTNQAKEKNLRILPCPVCFKAFTSATERQTHIKTCGVSHGLSIQQLIEASKLQSKQEEERLALGLPSPQVVQPLKEIRKKTEPSRARSSKSSDLELELAFALSRSLAEEERKKREKEEDELASLGLNEILQENRRKLVLPQPPPFSASGKGSRGIKGKRKGKSYTALETRTHEDRMRIITEKVAAILAGEYDAPFVPLPWRSAERSSSLFIDHDRYDKESRLWRFACTDLEVSLTSYYVEELKDYIKPEDVPFAELLKKYTNVPGRMNYTALAEDSDAEGSDEETPIESTIVDAYCTQLILAEMLCTQDIEDLTFSTDRDAVGEGDNNVGSNDVFLRVTNAESETSLERREEPNTDREIEDNSINNNNNVDLFSPHDNGFERKEEERCENKLQLKEEKVDKLKNTTDVELVDLSSDNDTSSTLSFSSRKLSQVPKPYTKPVTVEETKGLDSLDKQTQSPPPVFYSSKQQENIPVEASFRTKLVYDWSCLLANGDRSDLIIITEGSEIQVHSLVLFCRCPEILSEVVEEEFKLVEQDISLKKKYLNWNKISYEAVYAFIIYLYTGECPVKQKDGNDTWLGLYDLALKYKCSELIEYLESMYKASSFNEERCKEELKETCTPNPVRENFKEAYTKTPANSSSRCELVKKSLGVIEDSGSPDIFGDWEGDEQFPAYINSPNATPPGAVRDSILDGLKSPVLNLGETFQSFVENSSKKDSVCKSNGEIEASKLSDNEKNKSMNSEKLNKTFSKKSLSFEFKEISESRLNDSHGTFVERPETPPLRMSSFSDLDYPSCNEVVDLTLSSDQSDHEDNLEDLSKPVSHPNLSEKFEIEFGNQSSSSPILSSGNLDGNNCSTLSDLIDKPILNAVQTSPNNQSDIDTSPSTPYNKEIDILTEGDNRSNASKSSTLCRSNKEDSCTQNISDESFLKVVFNLEKGQEPQRNRTGFKTNFKKPAKNLYKSKSCFEPSSKTLKTPHKLTENEYVSNSTLTITPMPDYKSMMSPDLKRELDKYGIRKLSRKKAVTLLLHIYEQTHPLVTDSEAEASFTDTPTKKLQSKSSPSGKVSKKAAKVSKDKGTSQKAIERTKSSDRDFNSSQSSNTSFETSFDCMEETFLPASQEDVEDFTATQEVSFENQIKNFIRSNDELYARILRYDPIWANDLNRDLKLNGIKCSMAKLITFLDEQCITFRLPSRERTRKRPRKHSSPGRSPKKKQKKYS